ncbi:MAG: HD domain-containing protein [Clostridiales bacterium]|nr:HD domain-containing protein [Clostridiales bacterium]
MAYYEDLSIELQEKIQTEKREHRFTPLGFDEKNALRRIDNPHDYSSVLRGAFVRDVDKILNCPYYNRYSDKTQVFSLYKNDDITHRSLHVQLVSRIARTIGNALNLNVDLIEAIALGHDVGHTPFGHTGEKFLDGLFAEKTGRRFAHNIHSVRVLDKIFPLNLTLQTLSGIAAHNGEMELEKYQPLPLLDFESFDEQIEKCYQDGEWVKKLVPSTLEGCVMRICDIIAYLGKDRHDAEQSNILRAEDFSDYGIGKINAEIVNNLMVNIIQHSYGKPYIKMDEAHFEALQKGKRENYAQIYGNESVKRADNTIGLMMAELYARLLSDLENGRTSSPIFTQHIDYLNRSPYARKRSIPYAETEKNQIVVDYIAGMTDDYFIHLHRYLFPNSRHKINYIEYFD